MQVFVQNGQVKASYINVIKSRSMSQKRKTCLRRGRCIFDRMATLFQVFCIIFLFRKRDRI